MIKNTFLTLILFTKIITLYSAENKMSAPSRINKKLKYMQKRTTTITTKPLPLSLSEKKATTADLNNKTQEKELVNLYFKIFLQNPSVPIVLSLKQQKSIIDSLSPQPYPLQHYRSCTFYHYKTLSCNEETMPLQHDVIYHFNIDK